MNCFNFILLLNFIYLNKHENKNKNIWNVNGMNNNVINLKNEGKIRLYSFADNLLTKLKSQIIENTITYKKG